MERSQGYFTHEELKSNAKASLCNHWCVSTIVCIIAITLYTAPGLISEKPNFLFLLMPGPISFGLNLYFLRLSRNESAKITHLFQGFRHFCRTLATYLLCMLFILLWASILIIPGIIASISYSQVFFILADNPEIPSTEVMKISKNMMQGYRWNYFLLQLSFLVWGICCILTLGIGFLWLIPYIKTTNANFYLKVKANYNPANFQIF